MRVTNNMLSRTLLNNLSLNASQIQRLQDQMSSGKKINKPSDDPVGIQNSMRYKSALASVELWKNNASEATSYMHSADSSMTQVSSMLQRVRALALQGANSDLSPEHRATIATEVRELNEQIRIVANTKIGNRYIFAGEANEMPMPDPANPPTLNPPDPNYSDPAYVAANLWKGNDKIVTYQVGSGLTINISANGKAVFPDLIANLNELAAALESDTAATSADINNALGKLDINVDNVLKHQAELGARTNRLASVQSQMESMEYNLKSNISDIEDLDYAEAIIEYQNKDNMYRASLAVGMKIIQPSLLDFMR